MEYNLEATSPSAQCAAQGIRTLLGSSEKRCFEWRTRLCIVMKSSMNGVRNLVDNVSSGTDSHHEENFALCKLHNSSLLWGGPIGWTTWAAAAVLCPRHLKRLREELQEAFQLTSSNQLSRRGQYRIILSCTFTQRAQSTGNNLKRPPGAWPPGGGRPKIVLIVPSSRSLRQVCWS